MEFAYRKAESADSPGITELFDEMLRTIHQTKDVRGYQDGHLDKFFSGGDDRIYVAECGKEVVAFIAVETYRKEGYAYLDDLAVTAAYRDKGIGTRLIGLAEEHAGSLGLSAIVLHVEKTNEKARQLYRRLGYSDDEDQGSRIRMVKKIGISLENDHR